MSERKIKQPVLITRFGDAGCILESPRGIRYFAVYLETPGRFPNQPNFGVLRPVDVRKMRAKMLRAAISRATHLAETGQISTLDLEIVLDYIFAELNSRFERKTDGNECKR